MGRPKLPDLGHLACPGAEFRLRVTPRAKADALLVSGDLIVARTTAAPEAGAANEAVRVMLARALGVAKTRLSLVRGATSRDKVFRLDAAP